MAWVAINNSVTLEVIILYVSAIFWTLGYDTIYGAQDMSDDEIIGLKSTSIKFKNMRLFISFSYLITISLLLYLFRDFFGNKIFSFFIMMFFFTLLYQLYHLKKNDFKNYLKIFKLNNYSGLFLFLSICSINL